MGMVRRLVFAFACVALSFALAGPGSAGKDNKDKKPDNKKDDKKGDKKKDDRPEAVGQVVEVHRDKNAKDAELGHIVVKDKGKNEKYTVTKATDILRAGKRVEFGAIDKGDTAAVFAKKGHPHVADKILLKKD